MNRTIICNENSRRLWGWRGLGTVVVALALGTAGPMLAQRAGVKPAAGVAEGPPIASVYATVEDMATRQEIGLVEPGGHFEVRQGQQVRLRLVAEASGNRKRYPSTRFDVNQSSRHITVNKVNPEVGAVIVTGGQPNERGGAVPVQYEILENLEMSDQLRSGRFYLDVIPATAAAPAPEPEPEVQPEAEEFGATLFEDEGFRGRSRRLLANDRSFRDDVVSNDRISSVRVDRGCVLTLYRDENFGGESSEFSEDAYGLGGTRVGNDAASSARIECNSGGRGVTLYEDADWRGKQAFFSSDVPDLSRTEFGNDRASSIRIDEGCSVIIFGDTNYRGRSQRFADSLPRLNGTSVGNDAISSLQVICN